MLVSAFAAMRKFALHRFKNGRRNDGLVVSLHVKLRDFTIVPILLFREEIHSIASLQKRVALVLLVFEHVADGSGVPFFFVARRRDAISGELAGNAVGRHAMQ